MKTDTLIGKETTIDGNIKTAASIRIDGTVIGEIETTGNIYIGKGGHVKNKLSGKNIMVAGTIEGDVTAEEKIHLESKGVIKGSVTSRGLIIEDGAQFTGESHLIEEIITDSNKEQIEK